MTIGEGANEVHVTADYAEACALLQNGQKYCICQPNLPTRSKAFIVRIFGVIQCSAIFANG